MLKLVFKEIDKGGENIVMSTAEVLIQQGIQQGLSRGEYNKAVETAKRMLIEGFDIDVVVRITGLSVEEVERLKKS